MANRQLIELVSVCFLQLSEQVVIITRLQRISAGAYEQTHTHIHTNYCHVVISRIRLNGGLAGKGVL